MLPDIDIVGAEVRLRYVVSADQREPAARAAEAVKADLLARGAVSVKLEAEVRAKTRARAPEIAKASSVAAACETWWSAKSIHLDDARRARVLGRLGEIAPR